MARSDANINKETLEFICSQIGVTVSFLSNRTRYDEERVSAWLDAASADFPTINQAKGLAKVLKVPFAGLYMNKDNLPIKQLPKLRNLRRLPYKFAIDNSSLNLAVVELIRYHDFLISSESEMNIKTVPLSFPIISNTASVFEYAKLIREFFELKLNDQFELTSSRQFYLYVRQKIERRGIFVHCFTGVDVETVRGISIFNDIAPIIGINDNDRYPAKTFSIIHELVHILKRQSTLCNEMVDSFSSSNEEVFCNAVAGEVLVPTTSLNSYLTGKKITDISLADIEIIAGRFSISKEVIIRRLLDIKQFTQDEYDTFANEIRQAFLQQREVEKIARKEGHRQPILKNVSREAFDKTSPAICRILLIGFSDGYFSISGEYQCDVIFLIDRDLFICECKSWGVPRTIRGFYNQLSKYYDAKIQLDRIVNKYLEKGDWIKKKFNFRGDFRNITKIVITSNAIGCRNIIDDTYFIDFSALSRFIKREKPSIEYRHESTRYIYKMPKWNEYEGSITYNKIIRFLNNPTPVALDCKNTVKSIRTMPINEISIKYEAYENKLSHFVDCNKDITEYLKSIEQLYGLK